MPQPVTRLPLLTTLRRQATTALATVTTEIQQREHELATRKAEAVRWQSLLRELAAGKGPTAPPPRKRSATRRRLDWRTIFKQLPPRFTTTEIAQKSGKPVAQVYTSVSRWMKEKRVRRGQDGNEKV